MTAALRKYPVGAAYLALLALLALLPQPWKGRLATHGYVHDGAHVLAFTAAFLLQTWRRKSRANASRIGLLLLLFGALLEGLQTRVYGNSFEYRDVIADATGIALGFLMRSMWEG